MWKRCPFDLVGSHYRLWKMEGVYQTDQKNIDPKHTMKERERRQKVKGEGRWD